jgi:hypothetical protein
VCFEQRYAEEEAREDGVSPRLTADPSTAPLAMRLREAQSKDDAFSIYQLQLYPNTATSKMFYMWILPKSEVLPGGYESKLPDDVEAHQLKIPPIRYGMTTKRAQHKSYTS